MSERRRTGIKLVAASAVIALSGFGIGLAAGSGDVPEEVVAVGKIDRRAIQTSDSGGHHEGRCELKEPREWSAAPPAI
jgi:hypothetical protein